MGINTTNQMADIFVKIQDDIRYILPLIFPLICFFALLKGLYSSIKSGKEVIGEIISKIILLAVIITASIIYLKVIIDKSINFETTILFTLSIAWIVVQFLGIFLELLKDGSGIIRTSKTKSVIIIVIFVMGFVILVIPTLITLVKTLLK
jgi:hypothetical protein